MDGAQAYTLDLELSRLIDGGGGGGGGNGAGAGRGGGGEDILATIRKVLNE